MRDECDLVLPAGYPCVHGWGCPSHDSHPIAWTLWCMHDACVTRIGRSSIEARKGREGFKKSIKQCKERRMESVDDE